MPSGHLKDFIIQEKKIGRGSFGEVFLMAHKQTRKQYVLKKVRLSRLNDWQRNAAHMEMRLGMVYPIVGWCCAEVRLWLARQYMHITMGLVWPHCWHGWLYPCRKRAQESICGASSQLMGLRRPYSEHGA